MLIGDADTDINDVLALLRLGKADGTVPLDSTWDADCDFNHEFGVDLSGLPSSYGETI